MPKTHTTATPEIAIPMNHIFDHVAAQGGLRPRELPLAEQAYEYIIREVVFPIETSDADNTIKYGGKITESAIAKVLKMSNGPVREAIARLRVEGWIRTLGNRGSFLVDFSDPAIARGIYQIRLTTETGAFYTLATGATADQLKLLADILAALETAKEKADIKAFRERDIDFHMTVIELAGGAFLSRMIRPVLLQWYAMVFHALKRLGKASEFKYHLEGPGASSHRSLFEAIAAHNGEQAAELISNHYHHLARVLEIDDTKATSK